MTLSTDLTKAPEAIAAAWTDFAERILRRWKENLEMLLGWELELTFAGIGVADDKALRSGLPERAAALVLETDETTPALLLMEPALAKSMAAQVRMAAPDDVTRQRQEPGAWDQDTADSLGEISGLVVTACHEAGQRLAHPPHLEQGPVRFFEEGTWNGDDPLGETSYLCLSITCTLPNTEPDPLTLFVPLSVAERAAAQSVPDEVAPRAVLVGKVLCLGDEQISRRVATMHPEALVLPFASAGALVSALEAGAEPVLLVAHLPSKDLHLLDLLSALRRFPSLKGRPMLVLLENPVRSVVLRAGRLGLVNILPARVDDDLLKRRTSQLVSRARS